MSNNIRYYRKKKSISQRQLADAVGVDQSTIYRWEKNGDATIRFEHLSKIASVLDCTPEDLCGAVATASGRNKLDRISDNIDDISDNIADMSYSINKMQEEQLVSNDLADILSEITKLRTQQELIDSAKETRRHRKIRTAVIVVTCIIITIFVGIYLYIQRNYSWDGVYYYTETIYEVDINDQ